MDVKRRFYSVRCTALDKALHNLGLDHNGFWLVLPMEGTSSWGTLIGPTAMSMEEANDLLLRAAKEHPEATFELVRVDLTIIPHC